MWWLTALALASGVGDTPLHEAARAGDLAEVQRLLAEGASVTATTRHGLVPLDRAVEYGKLDVVPALVAAGSPLDRSLILAAMNGNLELVNDFLARGAAILPLAAHGGGALHAAAKYDHVDVIGALLEAGAEVDQPQSLDGFTPLHIASIEGHADAVRTLLNAGAKVTVRDRNDKTPLHWAVFAYRPAAMHIYADLGKPHDTVWMEPAAPEVVGLLLDAGSAIDARAKGEQTPLMEAAVLQASGAYQLLLDRGADATLTNAAGKTAAQLAAEREPRQLIRRWK